MARVWRHRRAIAAAFVALAGAFLAAALAEDQGPNVGTDLYDRPVLAVDPGMHTGTIRAQAVDAEGRYAVTGAADRTVRIWSVADGKLLRTIFVPVGPDPVGAINAVAISPDGSTIAAGGWTERLTPGQPIYLFDRESGALIRRIGGVSNVVAFLGFSPDGRYLAAMLGGANGLRVFDRDQDWSEAFRDDGYGDNSSAPPSRPAAVWRRRPSTGKFVSTPTTATARPRTFALLTGRSWPGRKSSVWIAFSPDGNRLAVGYDDVAQPSTSSTQER